MEMLLYLCKTQTYNNIDQIIYLIKSPNSFILDVLVLIIYKISKLFFTLQKFLSYIRLPVTHHQNFTVNIDFTFPNIP
jgi:hypothetical protein